MRKMKHTAIFIGILLMNISCGNSSNNKNESSKNETAQIDSVAQKTENGYEPGDIATDFKLKDVDGSMVSLADYKNAKGFIIVFTCNHCPFSQAYEDRIIALDKKYDPKGFPVIAINPTDPEKFETDSYKNMQKRAKEKGYTFPYLLDVGQKIFPQYGATNTPHIFVLTKTVEGNKVAYIGAIDDNAKNPAEVKKKYVEDAVDALLAGKEPKITKTKAIGCRISR